MVSRLLIGWDCLVNRLFISMVSMVLIGSVLSIAYLSPWCHGYSLGGIVLSIAYLSPWCLWYSLGVSCQSSIYLHGVSGTHWECLVNRLSISMVSVVLIGSVLSIIYLSPLCQCYKFRVYCQSSNYLHDSNVIRQSSIYLHGVTATHLSPWCHGYTHLECLVYRFLPSRCQWYSLGVFCKSPYFLHGVNSTHLEYLDNRLIISMVSRSLIGSVLSIVNLTSWCHGYSLRAPCQSSIYLHGVNGTHLECLVNRLFFSMVSWLLIEMSCHSSNYLHGANGCLLECLVNRLFIFIVSIVLFWSILSIVYLSPRCQLCSLGVSCQSSYYLHGVNGTH